MNAMSPIPHRPIPVAITAPLRMLLAYRNALTAFIDDEPGGEVTADCNKLNAIDNEIIQRPAATTDDVVMKLIVIAQTVADGAWPSDTDAGRVLVDAQRLFGIGYVHQHVLTQIGEVGFPPLSAFALAEVQYGIAKAAFDGIPDDAEDSDDWRQAEAAYHRAFSTLEQAPTSTPAEFIRKWRMLTHDGQAPVNGHAVGLMVGDAKRLGGEA